jgi:hypothetical protein
MKILISESQYYRLFESQISLFPDENTDLVSSEPKDLSLDEPNKLKVNKPKPIKVNTPSFPGQEDLFSGEPNNNIYILCKKYKNYQDLPYCELYKVWSELKDSNEKNSLNNSIGILNNKFRYYVKSYLPKIIELSLDSNNPVQYLETISDFMNNEKFNQDERKKQLSKLDPKTSHDDLEKTLTSIRNKVYQEYENSFVGENKVFDKNPTLLKLNYKDSETNKNSFFQLVKQIQDDGADEKKIAEDITKYIKISVDEFKTDPEKMKADVKTNQALKLKNGKEIFSAGTYFEIKKFGPNVDSHLSEFFAIFKQTYLSSQKPEYIDTYNNLIKTLYNEVKGKHSEFLDDIKSKIGGIILDNYIIIKIEDVDLYWSFLGQRKNENRLSIRYQLKPGKIIGYECNPSNNILKEVPITPEITGKIGILE